MLNGRRHNLPTVNSASKVCAVQTNSIQASTTPSTFARPQQHSNGAMHMALASQANCNSRRQTHSQRIAKRSTCFRRVCTIILSFFFRPVIQPHHIIRYEKLQRTQRFFSAFFVTQLHWHWPYTQCTLYIHTHTLHTRMTLIIIYLYRLRG